MIIIIPIPLRFQKSHDAKRLGKRLIDVCCDRCKCSFHYELVRVGTGISTDYRQANQKAGQELNEQLASDADLVACPECNWVNDELIKRHCKFRYRTFEAVMVSIGILGIVCSLIAAYFIELLGNHDSIGTARIFYFVVPAIFAGLTGSSFLLSYLLRWRIQPNRTFPAVPNVPLGTAPALFKESEKLVLAPSRDPFMGTDEGKIYLFPQHEQLPSTCCYCFDKTMRFVPAHVTSASSAQIPFCTKCRKELDRRFLRVFWCTMGLLMPVGAGLGYWFDSIWCAGATTLVVSFTLSLVVASIATPYPWRVLQRQHPLGQVCLQFRIQEYARVAAKHLIETAAENLAKPTEADRGEFKVILEGDRTGFRENEPSSN
jgi:hypothetical protein